MANIKRVVFTQNWNKGGVRTILEQVQKFDPDIRIVSKAKFGILSYLILFFYLLQSRVTLNIHGWMFLRLIALTRSLRLNRARIVFSLHSDPKKELTDFTLMELMSKVADHVTFVSDYHRMSALLLIGEKTRLMKMSSVIYYKMNCSADESSLGFHLSEGKVGLITRLSKEKGIEDICSILPVGSIIWGDGPLLRLLQEQYTGLKFPGVCDDVNEALEEIDIFVFSSSWGVWGISLLEAICAKKRFIYPQNENWKDLFPEDSYCLSYENGNLDSFNRALENAMSMDVSEFEVIRDRILNFPEQPHYKHYARI